MMVRSMRWFHSEMAEPVKQCFKCERALPLSNFYKHPRMADGHLGKCKECTKADVTLNRDKNLEYYQAYDRKRWSDNEGRRAASQANVKRFRQENPEKYKAHRLVSAELRAGRLTKPDRCEDCGSKHKQIGGHHEDYSKPLEVVWLCPACHGLRHRMVDRERAFLT